MLVDKVGRVNLYGGVSRNKNRTVVNYTVPGRELILSLVLTYFATPAQIRTAVFNRGGYSARIISASHWDGSKKIKNVEL